MLDFTRTDYFIKLLIFGQGIVYKLTSPDRGRPLTTWIHQIRRDTGISVTDALELAGDRSFRRQIATAECYGWSLRVMMMMMMIVYKGTIFISQVLDRQNVVEAWKESPNQKPIFLPWWNKRTLWTFVEQNRPTLQATNVLYMIWSLRWRYATVAGVCVERFTFGWWPVVDDCSLGSNTFQYNLTACRPINKYIILFSRNLVNNGNQLYCLTIR